MGFTVFHNSAPAPLPSRALAAETPAVAVSYARGGTGQADSLLLNAGSAGLLLELAGADGIEAVQLLYDPATGEAGIRPWLATRPSSTRHEVEETRWRAHLGPGGDAGEWSSVMRRIWPLKIEAAQFMGCWKLPEAPPARPAAARVHDGMVVFNPGKLVTA